MDGQLIRDDLRQRVLDALRREPFMHPSDLGLLRRNCTWAELSCFVPSARAAKRRFRRWAKKGIWDRLLQRSQPMAEPDALHVEWRRSPDIDSTAIKCHRTATGARGGGEEAIGRSSGGLTTKVHDAVDSLGFVRRLLTSPGQHADCRHAAALTEGFEPAAVVADKAYDTDALRSHWRAQGIGTCVPPKRNRLVQHAYDAALYRTRHMVENSFCRLKDRRRLSLRLDKTETSFRAFARFAAALMNWHLKLKLCP